MKNIVLTAALLAASAVSAQAATIVTNGSFESTPTPLTATSSWALFDSIEGWTAGAGEKIEVQSDPTLSVIDAQDGSNYVELHSNGLMTMSQVISLGAGRHELSFFYSTRENTVGDNDMSFSIAGLVDGAVLDAPNLDLPRGSWTEIAASFTVLTAGDYTLSFSSLTGPNEGRGALIDNVSVAAVPVPAAGLLLLTALGGAAAMRRKKG